MIEADIELVVRSQGGDETAFARIYDRYAPLVRAYCYNRTGELYSAQDLEQEVFLRVFKRLATLRRPEAFPKWLLGIARRVCREYHRDRSRERALQQKLSSNTDNQHAKDLPEEDIKQIRVALAALPERQRIALSAFYLGEQDVASMRALLGISRSGFYALLARARTSLARSLNGRFEGE